MELKSPFSLTDIEIRSFKSHLYGIEIAFLRSAIFLCSGLNRTFMELK